MSQASFFSLTLPCDRLSYEIRSAGEMNEVSHRFRFRLRTLLLVVLFVSIVTAFPVTLVFVAWIAPLAGPAAGLMAFVLVWRVTEQTPRE
jgi:hypothetical protein